MIPGEHERLEARALYEKLGEETRTIGELREHWLSYAFEAYLDAARCVDIAIRIADALADIAGAPRVDRALLAPRDEETPVEWIDRVSETIGQAEQREERHAREPRKTLP
jgi:hypothetical protein